jgi:hypothetical protein
MTQLTDTLVSLWQHDIEVFSKPWIYQWLCIPAAAYLAFYILKWSVITAPAWLPVVIIIRAIRTK